MYTSLQRDVFMILLGLLQRFEGTLQYHYGWRVTCISLEDQVLMALMKLRLKYPFQYSLKEEQITVIKLLAEKKNVMACLSTGFEKSDCFLLPPLIWDEVSANFKVDQNQGDIIGSIKLIHLSHIITV